MNAEQHNGATPIDPNEAEGLIPSLSTQAELNEFEASNMDFAKIWANKSTKIKRNLLDQQTLKLLHNRMFGKTWRWAGSYRRTQKSIGCDAWNIAAELKSLLDDVDVWLKSKAYTPNEIAARFHHRLVLIHPFPNGNGRFARLATDLLCQQQGWKVSAWGHSNLIAGAARTEYISSLRAADSSNYESLISFMFPEN